MTLRFSDDMVIIPKNIRADFQKIDLFRKENRLLLREFLFFFMAAIGAYLSIIFSRYPHTEDYVRNVIGYSCGTNGRVVTAVLEELLYFSNLVFDMSPFNQVLSCAVLAYVAVVLKKIFSSEKDGRFQLWCFLPAAVTPYLAGNMFFKFDNIYMMLAILSTVMAAYFTINNTDNAKNKIFFQILLLFCGLLLYQAALSAYFIICIYVALIKMTDGEKTILGGLLEMKGWGITMLLTAIMYFPLVLSPYMEYPTHHHLSWTEIVSLKRVLLICKKYAIYLHNFIDYWKQDFIYNVFFGLIILFSLSFVYGIFKNGNNIVPKVLATGVLLSLWLISPYGIIPFTAFLDRDYRIPTRVLGCIGIWTSLIFHRIYLLFQGRKILFASCRVFLIIFSLHNMMLLNSVGNAAHSSNALLCRIIFDISNDVDALTKNNCGDNKKKNDVWRSSVLCDSLLSLESTHLIKTYQVFDNIDVFWQVSYAAMWAHFNRDIFSGLVANPGAESEILAIKPADKKLVKSANYYKIYDASGASKNPVMLAEINGSDTGDIIKLHFFQIFHCRAGETSNIK
ncbi:MAG: glucosyltransferase domain-containing protein [Holosporaceae bacterium]|jgi:hypothetical protein|nr:glucosyltransferase domain-containing protein [Holosporaceae bacterium]